MMCKRVHKWVEVNLVLVAEEVRIHGCSIVDLQLR